MTDDLKKFLHSKFGKDLINKAMMLGQEFFRFGNKKYKLLDLKKYIDSSVYQ